MEERGKGHYGYKKINGNYYYFYRKKYAQTCKPKDFYGRTKEELEAKIRAFETNGEILKFKPKIPIRTKPITNIPEGFKEVKYKDVKNKMYYISCSGDIYSAYTNSLMKHIVNRTGYLYVRLMNKENKKTDCPIHRLVAYNYLGSPPQNMIDPSVDHIDGNKTNNNYKNLRWMTKGENSSCRIGKPKGEKKSKFTVKGKRCCGNM